MATKLLVGGVAGVLLLHMPLLADGRIILGPSYVTALGAICVFLCGLAFAAVHVKPSPQVTVAAVGVACGYVVLVSPKPLLGAAPEFVAAIVGAACSLVLGYRLARGLRQSCGRRGWLVFGAGLAGAMVLWQGGARRYSTYVTTHSGGLAEAEDWALLISSVLGLGTLFAFAGSLRGSRSGEQGDPGRAA